MVHPPHDNYQETSMHLSSGVCVAYYKFPGGRTFQMKRCTDVLTSHHSHTSSIPHVSSSLATSHVLIQQRTTVECSGPAWPFYQWIGTTDQADLIKLGSAQLNLMSLLSTLVSQLPIIEHKIDRHGGHSWKRQHPFDKPHADNDDEPYICLHDCMFTCVMQL